MLILIRYVVSAILTAVPQVLPIAQFKQDIFIEIPCWHGVITIFLSCDFTMTTIPVPEILVSIVTDS